MITRLFTLWSICIYPFAVYAHANVPHVVIARHVIIASDLVILPSHMMCLHLLITRAYLILLHPASFLSREQHKAEDRLAVGMSFSVPPPAGGSQVLRMSTPLQI